MILLPHQDPFGQAMKDYNQSPNRTKMILVESNLTEDESIPVAWLFRSHTEMPLIETTALHLCYGRVLDLGAGAGVHTLILQKLGLKVTATDLPPLAVDVMRKRGVEDAFCAYLLNFQPRKFDTILMLMNGIGLVETLEGLHKFLEEVKKYLNPKGQILCDSSDILYMYAQKDGAVMLDLNTSYYGEMKYKCTYRDIVGEWFDWLYVDVLTLSDTAKQHGFETEIITQNDDYSYLARLILTP